ncbi:hypothetical protein GMSM_24580 [Geomonas sp. Red276]
MSWQHLVQSAEGVLDATHIPNSQEIISLIKRINPTSLQLCETDREHGYRIKNRLQNLLLENYGEVFHLVPHPCSPGIVLIKHKTLPSVDACHADYSALSLKALDTVGEIAPPATKPATKNAFGAEPARDATSCSPRELVKNAELLIERYEYPQAEELLAGLRITDTSDLQRLVKAAQMLMGDMGAYQRTIELLLAQPRPVLNNKAVRELLALAYYGNGMIAEARALLDAAHPGDLGKSALHAYADISFRDGKLSQAYDLLSLAEEKNGFVAAIAGLRKEIESAIFADVEPLLREVEESLARNDLARAESLVQKALSLYPHCREARQLKVTIEARKSATEAQTLWNLLGGSVTAAERLDLLAKLLELDKENGEKIRELIAREKAGQKREALEDRLRALDACCASQQWSECFDILLWLARQGDAECYRRACRVDTRLSVLYRNARLQRLPDPEAKELWLGFVRLKRLLVEGTTEGCWDLARTLKPYFLSYPAFREEYDRALETEQEKARGEIRLMLARLDELGTEIEEMVETEEACEDDGEEDTDTEETEDTEEAEDTEDTEEAEGAEDMEQTMWPAKAALLAEAKRLVVRIRRRLPVLPAEEAAGYRMDAEATLASLAAPPGRNVGIFDYRSALLLGNLVEAAELREANNHQYVQEYLRLIDNEVENTFAISAEPVNMADLPAPHEALAETSAPAGMEVLCSSPRHLLFSQDDETIVVVNVIRNKATRYRSPNFKDLAVMDFLPEKDLFLFVNTKTNNNVWKAILSETESRFTATFEFTSQFTYQPGACFAGLFLSSGKDNAYYAFIREPERSRGVKQTLGPFGGSTVASFELRDEIKAVHRLSSHPDKFVVVGKETTVTLESNLTPPKRCSRVGMRQELSCIGIDPEKGHMYTTGDGIVHALNLKLYSVKQYHKAVSFAQIELATLARICVEKSTVLLGSDQWGMFYDFSTNKFSQKFSIARMASTETPARWYCWDFDQTTDTLKIRDITGEVDSLLEWRELLRPDQVEDEAAMEEFVKLIQAPDRFTIVQPSTLPPEAPQ